MTAALSLLSASALAIALLVPLRDDRRGNRATIGGNAPLRPLFPAPDRAENGGDTVPSAVSIRFAGEADVSAPVEVLSRIVSDAPESVTPVVGTDVAREAPAEAERAALPLAPPATRTGFTFRSFAAALGFHGVAHRREPSEATNDGDGDGGVETDPLEVRDEGLERTFAEEVQRLSGASAAPIFSAIAATADVSNVSAAELPVNAMHVAPLPAEDADARGRPLPEAGERPSGAPTIAVPVAALVSPPGIEAVGEAPSAGPTARTPSARAPEPETSNITKSPPAGNAGTHLDSNARGPQVDVAARAPREHGAAAFVSHSYATPIPIDRMRPPLTRLPLRPKREEISWPLSLSNANAGWSEATRHDFLRHAAESSDAELEPIVCAAFREEPAAGRLLALRALARRSAAGTRAIFLEALRRGDDDERAFAVDVFGDRGDREALVEALSDRLDAIAARAALACFGTSTRAGLERELAPFVDRARGDAILGLLAGVLL